MGDNEQTVVISDPSAVGTVATRRSFLRALGTGGTVVLLPSVFAACKESTSSLAEPRVQQAYQAGLAVKIDLSDDVGIFNFAFLLEQLDSKFYEAVVASPVFSTLPAIEQEVFTDLRGDEVVHREFYRTALGSARTVPDVTPNFAGRLTDRATILATAQMLEDTGIAAYNGAGRYLKRLPNLLTAGKIVSMEARHSAAIRDLIAGSAGATFADVSNVADLGSVEAEGRDVASTFQYVLTKAQPFLPNPVNLTNVPTAA